MPIHSCTLPSGGSGFKWGDHGECYPDRKHAERQAAAAYAHGYAGDEDIAALNIPFLIKLMEWAKEDALTDQQIHKVAQNMITKFDVDHVFTIDDYKAALADVKKLGEDELPTSAKRTDMMNFDRASVREVDQDGHLHVSESPISKANICPYYGREIPDFEKLGLDPEKVYKLYRDPKELKKATDSFHGKPLLIKHRAQMADDHDNGTVVGTVMNPYWDEPYLKAELVVWPGEAIDAIESDKQKELSSGYRYRADMTPGNVNGDRYDGRMVDILGNHVALVTEGRAGPDVVVGDQQLEKIDMKKKPLSGKAKLVKGALFAHLLPKLAADAKMIDLDKILSGVASDNWKQQKPIVAHAVTAAMKPVLAKDAAMEDVVKFLDILDNAEELGGQDAEWSDEDEKQYQALHSRRPKETAADSDDDDDDDKKKAAGAEDEEDAEGTKSKGAEDKQTVSRKDLNKAVKQAQDQAVANARAVREAEKIVRPYVGEVTAMDSAEEVYKAALDILKVDVSDVPASAYKHILLAQPKPGTTINIARDQLPLKAFSTRFPEVSRITRL